MSIEYAGRTWATALVAKVKSALSGKVDKVTGKGLSANDLTDTLKSGYDNAVTDVAALKRVGAEKNVIVGVKVNGTVLTVDSARNVDVTVPTDAKIASKIEGYGYQTAAQVEKAITDKGYQTADQVNTIISGKGYQTASQVNSTITSKGYQTSSQVRSAINSALSGITGIDFKVVTTLPTTGIKGTIYLVLHSHTDSQDSYDEYIWLSDKSAYEKIGNTDVDLSGYVKSSELTALTEADLNTMWGA